MEKKRMLILTIIILLFISCILLSYFYHMNKYTVSFETGTQDHILTQYLKKNNKVKEPKPPKKEGYIFIEWQLNGNKFNFNNKVTSDIVLTAKWLKEEYITIKYQTNSEYKIESEKLLKGSSITKLPESYKENYEFIGWYINDKLYINEKINDDITLIAHYKEIPIHIEYKIGDVVTIIGEYASSAYNTYAPYTSAIGWKRVVVNIIEGTNYPYVIGNEYGVTGFFKEESIQKER